MARFIRIAVRHAGRGRPLTAVQPLHTLTQDQQERAERADRRELQVRRGGVNHSHLGQGFPPHRRCRRYNAPRAGLIREVDCGQAA